MGGDGGCGPAAGRPHPGGTSAKSTAGLLLFVEESGCGVADALEAFGNRAVVAVAHDVGDLSQLGRATAQQDDHFTLPRIEQGKEVVEYQAVDDLGLGALDGMVSVSSTNRTLTLARLR